MRNAIKGIAESQFSRFLVVMYFISVPVERYGVELHPLVCPYHGISPSGFYCFAKTGIVLHLQEFKDVRVHALIICIKQGISIYFIDHSEFITVQCKKILSRANNEIKCFEFSNIKRALRAHLRTIIAI